MGPDERTTSDIEADAFFAHFNGASPNVLARIRREGEGDLDEIVREDVQFAYWTRMVTARKERQALHELDAWRIREEQHDIDALRRIARSRTGTGPEPLVMPAPRIATLTDEERRDTAAWWRRIEQRRGVRTLVRRIRTEIRNEKDDDRFAARANAAWRDRQRAFERAQWREVVAHRNARPVVKRANAWVAIDEDRALAIALAALEHAAPPHPQHRPE